MRILVTGASGLLGLNVALEAAENGGHTVFGVVHSRPLRGQAFHVLQADLTGAGVLEKLLDETQPDWVIHCAAMAILDDCEANPVRARQLNADLPGKLAALVGRGGARLLHVSTDAVFDGERGGYSEEDLPNPLSVYGQTKLAGERSVAETNPQAIVARVNMFGWSLSGDRSLAEWFINNLSNEKRVAGFTDVFFCPLLVNHLAHLFFRMLENGLRGLYHVVSPDCPSKYDFGIALARQFSLDEALISPASVEGSGLKAARSPRLTLRSGKLVKALGCTPPSLSTAIQGFYTLYQQGYPQKLRAMNKTNGGRHGDQSRIT